MFFWCDNHLLLKLKFNSSLIDNVVITPFTQVLDVYMEIMKTEPCIDYFCRKYYGEIRFFSNRKGKRVMFFNKWIRAHIHVCERFEIIFNCNSNCFFNFVSTNTSSIFKFNLNFDFLLILHSKPLH